MLFTLNEHLFGFKQRMGQHAEGKREVALPTVTQTDFYEC